MPSAIAGVKRTSCGPSRVGVDRRGGDDVAVEVLKLEDGGVALSVVGSDSREVTVDAPDVALPRDFAALSVGGAGPRRGVGASLVVERLCVGSASIASPPGNSRLSSRMFARSGRKASMTTPNPLLGLIYLPPSQLGQLPPLIFAVSRPRRIERKLTRAAHQPLTL